MKVPRPLPHRPAPPRALVAGLCSLAGFALGSDPRPPLNPSVLTEALPVIANTDALGMGAEARRIEAWARARRPPLSLRRAEGRLVDSAGQSIAISPSAARVLGRLDQWYGLQAPEDRPITPTQLASGALRPDSVDRIRDLFEAAIARGVRLGDQWITPESGGEAVLDDALQLVEARDARWTLVRELAGAAADPAAVARLVEERAEAIAAVDTHGLLKVAAARFRRGGREAGDELRRATLTVARNAAATYEHDPGAQLTLIASREWRGRYVGRWHLHPPHDAGDSWGAGGEPSYEDMQNAVAAGQYLTLAFHPDGFDLYDASALGDLGKVDVSALEAIRYRSPRWRAHFATLHRKSRAPGPRPARKPS